MSNERSHIPLGADVTDMAEDGVAGGLRAATVTLTHDDILALPTIPFVVVPPTETLNYETSPTSLPIPAAASVVLNAETSYGTVDPEMVIRLVWGSDYSLDASLAVSHNDLGAEVVASTLMGHAEGAPTMLLFGGVNGESLQAAPPLYQDNALCLAARNGSLGDFTGGGTADTMVVHVLYHILEIG